MRRFHKVLIANRGAIACRIIRTLRKMGIGSVAVYSDADRHALHVEQADESFHLGPAQAALSYLNTEKIFEACEATGAEAIHPGYGFLSENAAFAEECARRGIVFIGPAPDQIRAFGLKHTARAIAARHDVPLLPGTELLETEDAAAREAARTGYPVMLKSTAGGGGIGMRVCRGEAELRDGFATVQRLGATNFKDSGVYLEKFVERARHIEVQIFGDGNGRVLALGERDCSAQRRNQKVIEETPAPGLLDSTRAALFAAAVKLGEAVRYAGAGTVEFIYDDATRAFYFLEVNTRLQVEHGVTEEVTGLDLVEWMVLQAQGGFHLPAEAPRPHGASIQVRVYAEDPGLDFAPSSGKVSDARFSSRARVDGWITPGVEVTPFYDPLLAKIIVRAEDRAHAVRKLTEVLAESRIDGLETNLLYLRQVVSSDGFHAGGITTSYLRGFAYQRNGFSVVEAGTQTTVQDWPGRIGYWDVGVPPSGPMDALSFRLANRIVGNSVNAPALECTFTGPSLLFHSDSIVALTGADMQATLDGAPVMRFVPLAVRAGQTLQLNAVEGPGSRAYIAVRGGLDVPEYLGSRATFILGKFGGHGGRVLRPGDTLHTSDLAESEPKPAAVAPALTNAWNVGVLYGPHGAPDYFTEKDMEMFFSTAWKVHYNSDRTGVRLIGPKPEWARTDGGEAGLHPSNIHDNAYAIGTVDFTGDMPVVLGPDGPSLGGFVCPATMAHAELWKQGQFKPGDTVRFHRLRESEAARMEDAVEYALSTLDAPFPLLDLEGPGEAAILARREAAAEAPALTIRAGGDKYLLLEYGPNVLDMNLRFRVHALMEGLRHLQLPGVIDITPGIRSLHVHYDSRRLPREQLLEALHTAESVIPSLDDLSVPSRIVHLPLSWDDPQTQLAIQKYMQGVRPDAPWCPSNIEFIRRINGLGSIDEVYKTVFGANYLVLGLGDVYLGAPVATPVDPRHRLVTTKYNPARTWTPENAVGIGGAYLCVYGMEGPGGYQFVGRTVQMWNTWRSTPNFEPGTPWLLRFFDQIRFYPVSAGELLEMREAFPYGKFEVKTEAAQFKLSEHHAFLNSIQHETAAFRRTQGEAFAAERERWKAAGHAEFVQPPDDGRAPPSPEAIPAGCQAVRAPITASVWNVAVQPGQRVEAGERLIILEAMKMELAVAAPRAGIVEQLRCAPGAFVSAGQDLLVLRTESEAVA
ncbi:MAG: urea carboxylase [Acidobacteria bacterium]|nr:urea carboxylase [Acidobacteriota bacterium]